MGRSGLVELSRRYRQYSGADIWMQAQAAQPHDKEQAQPGLNHKGNEGIMPQNTSVCIYRTEKPQSH